MSKAPVSEKINPAQVERMAYPPASTSFDWVTTLLSTCIIGGLFLDGWAHSHGKVDNTFFTLWHAILYTGVLAMFLFLAFNQWRNMSRNFAWRRALPEGYSLSLAGAFLFLVGGGLDLIWHTLFGIEVSIEALLSPTHLILATSGVLMISGPVRSAWARLNPRQAHGWKTLGPLILSMTLILSILTFFTSYAHPISQPDAAFGSQRIAIASILLQTALLMGCVLLLVGRWTLPFGALTLLFTLNGLLMTVFNEHFYLVIPTLLSGLAADFLFLRLKPALTRPLRFYLVAFSTPVFYYSFYFLTLQLAIGIDWKIHLWLGTIVIAGITGLFVGFTYRLPLPEQTT